MTASSGIGNPIKIYNAGATGQTTVNSSAETFNYVLNLTQNGVLQGFLTFVNIQSYSISPPSNNYTVSILRNQSTLMTQSFYLGGGEVGLIFAETLNFLAGAEIQSGETFTLRISHGVGTADRNPVFDAGITAVVRSVSSTLQY